MDISFLYSAELGNVCTYIHIYIHIIILIEMYADNTVWFIYHVFCVALRLEH